MFIRTQALAWAAGAHLVWPLNALDVSRSMRAPLIKNAALRMSLTYNTGSSGGPARMLAQTLSRIRLADASKDRVNLRGSSARIMNQVEFGTAYQDGTNTAATQTAVVQDYWLNFPFNPWKSRRRNDYGIPLYEFVDGGALEVEVNSSAVLATNYQTITSGTFQWFFDVDETRVRELKSRLCYRDVDITQTEFQVPIGGALRWFAYYVGEGSETNQAALAAQNFTSQTLEYSVIPREALRNRYRLEQISGIRTPDAGAAIAAEDVFYTMQAVMLQMVDEDAKIPEMPQIASLHVQTDGSVPSTTPKYVYAYLADRDPALAARTLNADTPGQLVAAVKAHGHVKTANGNTSSKLNEWTQDTTRVLPMKLRIPSSAQ